MDYETLLKDYAIALTGGIACGKSTIANIIRKEGFLVIDADQVARQVVSKGSQGLDRIKLIFGTQYLDQDGNLDRSKLRDLISNSHEAKEKLESITHPLIYEETERLLKSNGLFENPKIWFYEVALIYEVGREKDFKEVWVAYCNLETQVARVMERDTCTKVDAEKIISIQIPASDKAQRADYAISTDISMSDVASLVKGKLVELAREDQ